MAFFSLSRPSVLVPMAALGEAWMPGAVLSGGRYRVVADISGKRDGWTARNEGKSQKGAGVDASFFAAPLWPRVLFAALWRCVDPPDHAVRSYSISGIACRQQQGIQWPATYQTR